MPVTHEPRLVALSVIIAIQGAYVGLSLAVQVAEAIGVRRRVLLAGAALSLGVAIWSMHFVAMLAARLPFPVDYLVFPTLLSFLVCVIVVGVGVFAASAGPLTPARLGAAAAFMGLGIVCMHYIGMWALHASAHMMHAATYTAASVAIAVAASGLALFLAGGGPGRPPLILSAAVLGSAIAGMHYTAMAGLALMPHGELLTPAPALSPDLMAIIVAVVAFAVSGVFLLTLVPEGRSRSGRPFADLDGAWAHAAAPAANQTGDGSPHSAENGFAVLPPGEAQPARLLPVERDGGNRFIAVRDVVAVHANAHYTTLFDGTSKHFCPLPIGEVQARLDPAHFVRVHRSHIVNIEHVVGLKRAGDHGLIKLAGRDAYTVPVSRSRYGGLKSQLGLRPSEALS
jgi:NO-binding membrane sensor protein with MHYT domain